MRALRCAVLALAFFSATVCAAENPFVGSWKFDAARSKLVAETIQYRDLGGGRMHFSNGATLDYDFALDGKDHKTVDNRTISWKPLATGSWETTIKIAGKTTETAKRTLSADGKAMTVRADGTLPDGSPYKHKKHYARVGAGTGLAGTWRNTEVDTNNMPDGYVIQRLQADVMFRTNDATMEGDVVSKLEDLGKLLALHGQLEVQLHGFADPRGASEKNLELSLERANAVREALIRGGAAPEQIQLSAHGSDLTTASKGDLEAYAWERRVSLSIRPTATSAVAHNE